MFKLDGKARIAIGVRLVAFALIYTYVADVASNIVYFHWAS